MKDIPKDLVWDLPCVQQASYLEGGPLMWMLPLYRHFNQKSDDNDDDNDNDDDDDDDDDDSDDIIAAILHGAFIVNLEYWFLAEKSQ